MLNGLKYMDIKNFIIIVLFIISSTLTYIHFFYIDSYDQCVLTMMDGRNVKLADFARRICREDFPEVFIDPWEVDKKPLRD